jgi:hypothetical protein
MNPVAERAGSAAPSTDPAAADAAAAGPPPRRRRWRPAAAGAVILLAAGAVTVGVTNPFRGSKPPAHGTGPAALATVAERSLSSQTQVDGTLGYAGSYSVVVPAAAGSQTPGAAGGAGQGAGTSQSGEGQAAGTFTALPAVGHVARQGQRLYSVNGSAVALLYGCTPAYRSLSEGMKGADVRQLNADLVALGYAKRAELDPHSRVFSAATASAVAKLQDHLGLAQTGTLALGQAVFLPTGLRVTDVSATLGAPAQPGTPVLQATSTRRQVTAQLDATQQSDVKPGQHVTITLPGDHTTSGVVTSVGSVATNPSPAAGSGQGSASDSSGSSGGSSGSSGNSGDATPTVEVDIRPTDPSAAGALDQTPVQVTITMDTVRHALVVPVAALLAQPGGYAVEVAGPNGARHLVPVSLGLFDDADGLVQVTSDKLSAGQSVVVPRI